MGHNIDLQWLLGLPEYVRCPKCKEMTRSWFEEYDIDCGDPHVSDEEMILSVQCDHCTFDFDFKVNVSIKTQQTKKKIKKFELKEKLYELYMDWLIEKFPDEIHSSEQHLELATNWYKYREFWDDIDDHMKEGL